MIKTISLKEAAKIVGCDANELLNLVKSGDMPRPSVIASTYIWKEEEFNAWLERKMEDNNNKVDIELLHYEDLNGVNIRILNQLRNHHKPLTLAELQNRLRTVSKFDVLEVLEKLVASREVKKTNGKYYRGKQVIKYYL